MWQVFQFVKSITHVKKNLYLTVKGIANCDKRVLQIISGITRRLKKCKIKFEESNISFIESK